MALAASAGSLGESESCERKNEEIKEYYCRCEKLEEDQRASRTALRARRHMKSTQRMTDLALIELLESASMYVFSLMLIMMDIREKISSAVWRALL